jgi:hypothetical protein
LTHHAHVADLGPARAGSPFENQATEQPLRERGSPGETDGHKPAKYFHPLHFQWPAALPAIAGSRLAAIPMLRCNWKNPATPQPRPPASHRQEMLESKSPHGRLQQASNGQRKCKAPQPSARAPRVLYTSSAQENFVWLVFIGVHRRSSAANMGFWFSRRTGEKAHRAAEVLPSGGSGGVAIISTCMLRTRSCRREPYRFSACIINNYQYVGLRLSKPTPKCDAQESPAQTAMHRGWIRNFYPIGGQKVRMSLPEGE